MSVNWSCCGALCLVACTFDSAVSLPEAATAATDTSDEQAGSTGEPPSGEASWTDTSGETSPPTTTTPTTTSITATSITTDDTGDTGDTEVPEACPQPLPDGWVLCEDFEDVDGLADHFAAVNGPGIAIGGPGYNSPEALEITHFAQQGWVGQLLIRFGQGPSANNIADPTNRFDEVWVRMRFRAGEGWPGGGPGDLLSVDGVEENPDWAATFKARISSGQSESSLRNSAFTCVFGNQHLCTGTEDWTVLDYLGGELGQVPVFDESVASEWHCAVLHARLNTSNNSDGLIEVEVDGQADASLTGIDFRGARTDLGFNLIDIPTFTQTPMQNDHRRYIDDLVVSTQALDCE